MVKAEEEHENDGLLLLSLVTVPVMQLFELPRASRDPLAEKPEEQVKPEKSKLSYLEKLPIDKSLQSQPVL